MPPPLSFAPDAWTVAVPDLNAADATPGDRVAAGVGARIETAVAILARRLREDAGHRAAEADDDAVADLMAIETPSPIARLRRAGLLNDPDLRDACVADVRLALLSDALPAGDAPSLLSRLTNSRDGAVAAAARETLAASSRARTGGGAGEDVGLDQPLRERLARRVAAALRDGFRDLVPEEGRRLDAALDAAAAALATAPVRTTEAAAMHLAAAIAAEPDELPTLIEEALYRGGGAMFAALVARASGLGFGVVRTLVCDPAMDRLLLAMHAAGLPRSVLVTAAARLSVADPARDLEQIADTIDQITALTPAEADAAIAPARLHPEYRAARRVLREAR